MLIVLSLKSEKRLLRGSRSDRFRFVSFVAHSTALLFFPFPSRLLTEYSARKKCGKVVCKLAQESSQATEKKEVKLNRIIFHLILEHSPCSNIDTFCCKCRKSESHIVNSRWPILKISKCDHHLIHESSAYPANSICRIWRLITWNTRQHTRRRGELSLEVNMQSTW